MDFGFDDVTEDYLERLQAFMNECVYPAEPIAEAQAAGTPADGRWSRLPVMGELQSQARERGLWNLALPDERYGAGLSNVQYAPLAELSGRSPFLAPEAMNCSAPDTGNMELLALAGTDEQRAEWLDPLLTATIRSAFCMTEPDVASSDARNIRTSVDRDGSDYVINGRKWWSTGAMSPNCALFIVMGVTDRPDTHERRRHTMILVPRDTPGVSIVQSLNVFGFSEAPHGGHAEIVFDDVRVPASNVLGAEGEGLVLAQRRLGPGRVHHCMRLIGMAERALSESLRRATQRHAFGSALADKGVIQEWIAESRARIDQARLLVLKTAWMMDTAGNRGARAEIAVMKATVPASMEWVIDKAIQVHGAGGLSQAFPLAAMWSQARLLRLADGPDEVHKATIARKELAPYRSADE